MLNSDTFLCLHYVRPVIVIKDLVYEAKAKDIKKIFKAKANIKAN